MKMCYSYDETISVYRSAFSCESLVQPRQLFVRKQFYTDDVFKDYFKPYNLSYSNNLMIMNIGKWKEERLTLQYFFNLYYSLCCITKEASLRFCPSMIYFKEAYIYKVKAYHCMNRTTLLQGVNCQYSSQWSESNKEHQFAEKGSPKRVGCLIIMLLTDHWQLAPPGNVN